MGGIGEFCEPVNMGSEQGEVLSVRQDAVGNDLVPFPPPKTESVSPNRQFAFVVQSPDEWKSKYAVGRLFQRNRFGSALVWEEKLPEEYGPRFVVVGNEGQVLLLDEWSNVKSKHALWLRNFRKRLNVSYNFDKVAQVLGSPVASIVAQAKIGWWIAGEPTLDETGNVAIVPTAGKRLRVDLNTGTLSLF